MNKDTYLPRLFDFISRSPTPYHATSVLQNRLADHGFIELSEGCRWALEKGKRYYVVRNGGLIAFSLGIKSSPADGFRIIGAHTDSPSLQIKPHTQPGKKPYLVAGVEKYGGAILHTWFDRELSLAGRVAAISSAKEPLSLLIDFQDPIAIIPSLAIHLDRNVNEGIEVNIQDMLSPVLAQNSSDPETGMNSILLEQANKQYPGLKIENILGFDLFFYDSREPGFIGINREFIGASRLDNLLSCHVGLEAICEPENHVNPMLLYTNHEEVGSTSNSGALGSFPDSVISRILPDPEQKAVSLHHSFLLSLDNAHATHPNFKDKSDPDHQILLNHGPVIKINASQRYSSTAQTASLFRMIASEAGIPTQDFVMRSDMACGSTIGPLSSAQLGVNAVDIGIPTWGMHSIREVTGSDDPYMLFRVVRHFLQRKQLPRFSS